MICHRNSAKYNRRQIINHVSAKHIADKSTLRTRTARGTRIGEENDRIIQMERDYGRITTEIKYDEQTGRGSDYSNAKDAYTSHSKEKQKPASKDICHGAMNYDRQGNFGSPISHLHFQH